MDYIRLPHTDVDVSTIALGTWVFSGDVWGGAKKDDCIGAIHAALEYGVNLIDTAPIYGYGLAETIVGRAIKGKRERCILATKCGLVGTGADIKNNLTPSSIRSELENSLERLQTDYIDLYQCHWPDPKTPIEETLDELLRMKAEGKIRYIGVSNTTKNFLTRAAKHTTISTTQEQYSLLERKIEKDIMPVVKKAGLGILAYGPLGGGILTGKYMAPPKFQGPDARKFFYKFYSGPLFNEIETLLDELGSIDKPLNQIAINWVRQQSSVTSVLVGCRNTQQVQENMSAASWRLSTDEMQRIHDVVKRFDAHTGAK